MLDLIQARPRLWCSSCGGVRVFPVKGCVLRVLGLKFLRIDGSIDPKDPFVCHSCHSHSCE